MKKLIITSLMIILAGCGSKNGQAGEKAKPLEQPDTAQINKNLPQEISLSFDNSQNIDSRAALDFITGSACCNVNTNTYQLIYMQNSRRMDIFRVSSTDRIVDLGSFLCSSQGNNLDNMVKATLEDAKSINTSSVTILNVEENHCYALYSQERSREIYVSFHVKSHIMNNSVILNEMKVY